MIRGNNILQKFKIGSHNSTRPFRREMLSKELLELRAKDLANENPIKETLIKAKKLKNRFRENYNVLNRVYFTLSDISKHQGFLAAGADWLLDNYHVIDEQVKEIRRDLPSGYYNALPKISSSEWKGYPRVYRIACDYLEHTDSHVQLDTLTDYINSFQEVSYLKLSELWAIPIMLRLAIVENIRRLSESILEYSRERQEAEDLFNQIIKSEDISAIQVLNNILSILSHNQKLLKRSAPFIVRKLRSIGSKSSLGIQWIEEQLKALDVDLSEVEKIKQQHQAADQISLGNSITSLKQIGRMNWRDWVEDTSIVNKILKNDPSQIFSKSDFYTRDYIRHRLELLSQRVKEKEEIVAQTALTLSQMPPSGLADKIYGSIKNQVGFYLIDDGLPYLEDKLQTSPPWHIKLQRNIKRQITEAYITSIIILTLFFSLITLKATQSFTENLVTNYLIFILTLIPASQLASEIIQWLTSIFINPKPLPKIEIENKISDEHRTAVVIQSIIISRDHLKKTIEDLEIRAIGNLDTNVHYGILADLPDSQTEHQSGDRGLITLGCDLIKELNLEYKEQGSKFFIMFRKRLFNPAQNCFMAWERKRGKISEFNRLIRGDKDTSFSTIEADLDWLSKAQYIITLDNDTHLPPGTVKKLIGCAAHPLNYPIYDNDQKKVLRGYGIIQPRVGITLESSTASVFSQIFSGQSGLDPYTQAISDVYQDLFKSASYIGKGIYQVDAFEKALEDQIPENTVLSHDLLESGYARCGLASDIEVFDDFPQRYHTHAKRQHRWIRGDWQLLPWITGSIKNQQKSKENHKPLTKLVKWKLLDNLRRSLIPISLVCLFFLFNASNISALKWVAITLILIGFRSYSLLYTCLFAIPFGYSLSSFFGFQILEAKRTLKGILIEISTLPHQAYLSLDAILRTLSRVYFSKKDLLEWQTALSTEQKLANSLSSFTRILMPPVVAVIITSLTLSVIFANISLPLLTICLLWLSSPYITWKISNSKPIESYKIPDSDENYLHSIAHDTWRYFRHHLKDQYNYLIPDNLQQIPESVVAERTSPTNISLSLLSILSAYDLGFIPSPLALEKISRVLQNILKLEKHNGHLLNWYAITDLRPLHPKYVSSVDSGNFVGHLIALREALQSLPFSSFTTKKCIQYLKARGLLEKSYNPNDQWHFYTHMVHELISATNSDNKENVPSIINKELIDDIKMLGPYTSWLKEVAILEELGQKGLLPKKLERFNTILRDRILTPSLNAKMVNRLLSSKSKIPTESLSKEENEKIGKLFESLSIAHVKLTEFYREVKNNIEVIDKLVDDTDFEFLFDKPKKLLSIGYNIDTAKLDTASYDLLASEARLASFIAIAKGDLPQTHWFVLGRSLTDSLGGKALISWSGTMFEYLMPTIVMKEYKSTLLSKTYHSIIKAQKLYAKRRNVPWGISESAFGTVDFENTYQYRAFGVPGLGLKRGLVDDLVISPYSTILSLQIEAESSIDNLKTLESIGARGEFGFYESIDYTEERLVAKESYHIIKSFFAHHQGMSLVAINNTINNNSIVNKFHSNHLVKSCELLLQERFPTKIPLLQPHQAEQLVIDEDSEGQKDILSEHFLTPSLPFPRTHLLSNNEYNVFIDHCGSGFSSYKSPITFKTTQLNRFRDDAVNNCYGQYIYIRDEESGHYWNTTFQPTRIKPDFYEVIYSPHKTEHIIKNKNIFSLQETIVSPEDSLEIRRVSITNHSQTTRRLSTTSFFEVNLADFRADLAHPAFSKLFVNSKWDNELDYLLFNRKPRSKSDISPLLFHMVTSDVVWERNQFTTDRANFIGRGKSLRNPQALSHKEPLAGETGYVLDPCASIRHVIELAPSETTVVYYLTGIAQSEEDAQQIIKKYKETYNLKRTFELAWSYASVELKNQHFSKGSSKDFQRLANCIIYNIPDLRKKSSATWDLKPQNALWRLGISGDEPIVLVYLSENQQVNIFNELVLAHEYLRARGITFDLVVLNDKTGGYLQELQDELESFLRASMSSHLLNQRGGIFIKNALHISQDEKNLLEHCARVIFHGDKGGISQQLKFETTKGQIRLASENVTTEILTSADFNSKELTNYPTGKFNDNTNEFEIEVSENSLPPQPWSNVIANKDCGFLITESGTGYTWFNNSRENRLTPWSNDPIIDPIFEVCYIRDCLTSEYWSATLKPITKDSAVKVTHGFGYSAFQRTHKEIHSDLSTFVSKDDPVRYWNLNLSNQSSETKTLEVIFYLEWILGVSKSEASRTIITGVDKEKGFLYAKNPWGQEFGHLYSIIGSNLGIQDFTTNRASFLGPSGSMSKPSLLEGLVPEITQSRPHKSSGTSLSREVGTGFDSAAILKYEITLEPGDNKDLVFFACQSENLHQAQEKISKYSSKTFVTNELKAVKEFWQKTIKPISISTPSQEFNRLVNGWLLYQTLSCRMFARTGFFQSSGALGFRDQLQDSLAFLMSNPETTKNQILLHASRQFEEGDVQHWWHPPSGRGIRTKISDGLLWLPYAVLEYIDSTGDTEILKTKVSYLKGPKLEEDQHDLYFTPELSTETGSLYDHCCRALDRSLAVGSHGLPLIGSGDWNDGMNEVGAKHKGESVWLAWFLSGILKRFSNICEFNNDEARKLKYLSHSNSLTSSIESNAWDGSWYRRAYFDDGTPLGTHLSEECKIDSLAQSWSVITDLGNKERRRIALQEAKSHLFDKENQLVRLLWPPLEKNVPYAGYIQSYPPGIRENGGQYTHGSTWLIAALALENFNDDAFELFNAMNPITHADTHEKIAKYKTEPYVTCGDVYTNPQHPGRGGWSWYTGSSSWLYQIAIKYILGLDVKSDGLHITPRVPSSWNEFRVTGNIRGYELNINAKKTGKTKPIFIAWENLANTKNIEVDF